MDGRRAIETLEGNKKVSSILIEDYKKRENEVQKCYEAAKSLGHRMFAIRDGGECSSSPMAQYTYNKYGVSSECMEGGEGGIQAIDVYKIKGSCFRS